MPVYVSCQRQWPNFFQQLSSQWHTRVLGVREDLPRNRQIVLKEFISGFSTFFCTLHWNRIAWKKMPAVKTSGCFSFLTCLISTTSPTLRKKGLSSIYLESYSHFFPKKGTLMTSMSGQYSFLQGKWLLPLCSQLNPKKRPGLSAVRSLKISFDDESPSILAFDIGGSQRIKHYYNKILSISFYSLTE